MGKIHNTERLAKRAWSSKDGWLLLQTMDEEQKHFAALEWFSVLRPRMIARQQNLQAHIKKYGATSGALSRLYRRAQTITMYDETLTF